MKKFLAYLLVAVMAFSVIGMLNLAAPMKASADSGNLALNKPVTEELNDCVSWGDPYWSVDYINDGERFDNTTYGADNAPVCNQYGWYVVKQDLEPMNASATIDLEGTYDVCRIKLYTEYHFLGTKFPNTYDVYVSADGTNWTRVCGEAGRTGHMTHAREFEFDKISARYVKSQSLKETTLLPTTISTTSSRVSAKSKFTIRTTQAATSAPTKSRRPPLILPSLPGCSATARSGI